MALSRARLPLLAATAFSFSSSFFTYARDADAWTPTTHVYLAQKAWEDAQDGKVTINTVDHEGRTVGASKGEYEVSPEILIAIRQNPHAFYAGVLGPDAYPDILTGQMRIHPPGHGYGGPDANTNGAGTDAWLTKLWNAAHTGADRTNPNLAFATGYLSHAAGDMFAHTFMNTFTGGIFDLMGTNGVKHIVLEGYVGARVPAFNPVSYPFGGIFGGEAVPTNGSLPIYEAVDRFGIDNGVREFIARTMIDPPAVAVGVGQTSGVEKNRQFSIPAIFSDLRQELRSSVAAYEAQDQQYAARANYTNRLAYWAYTDMRAVVARACGKKPTPVAPNDGAACPDPTFTSSTCPPEYPTGDAGMCFLGLAGAAGFAVAMSFVSAGANAEWGAWRTLGLRELNYIRQRSQIHEIDLGLESWIDTSHNAALAWFFNPDGSPDVSGFIDEYTWFATHRLISMTTGLPSWPIDTFGAIVDFIPNLIKPHIEKMKRDFVEYIIQTSFGMSSREFRDKYTKPYVVLDQLFAGNRPSMSIARINAIMNVPSFDTSDIGNPIVTRKTWTVDVTPQQKIFPAAYNTMVMIKLLMLKPSEVDRLIRDLGGSATLGPQPGNSVENNPMLGFLETIDGSHQWQNGKKLVFARECTVYRQLFMNQRPWPALPNEPTDPNLQAGVEPFDSSGCKGGKLPGFPGLQTPPAPPPAPAKQLPPPPPPPFQIASSDAKPLAPGELPSHPPNALFPGQSLVLSLAPSDVPHKWSIVSGGGKLSDPPDPVTGASPQAQAAKIAEIEKKAARTALTGSACGKGDLKCLQKTHTDVATVKKERRMALAGMRVVRATPLTLGTVIYEAPATMSGTTPQIVTVKAEATDGSGRSTTIALALLPQPPALNVKAPATVRAGGTFALVNDPPIPVKWTIVSGGGTIGDPTSPVRAQLMSKDITPFVSGMRQADAKLTALPPEPTAPPPSPTPNRFDRGPGGTVLKANPLSATPQIAPVERQKAMTDKTTLVRDRQKDLVAAAKKVEEIDGTYRAPVKVIGTAQSVVIKGVALDGTGRSTTITVQVTP